MALLLAAALAVSVLVLFTAYCRRVYAHWREKGVPGPAPRIFFGNSQNPVTRKTPVFVHLKAVYDEFRRRGDKHVGIYSFVIPTYLPLDPDYVKDILTRDFRHFVDRGLYHNERDDPLSAHLVSLEGRRWKALRAKLTPTFTSGKMKTMLPIVLECGGQMLTAMEEELAQRPLDVKEVLGCFATDVIGSCAFGLDCNSFTDPLSEFRRYGREAFAPTLGGMLRVLFCINFPRLARRMRVKIVRPDVATFFTDVVRKTVDHRESNAVRRQDFMQILLDLKNEGGDGLSVEEMAAQAFVFFLAGFETSSTTMAFCLLELAQNRNVQDKVRGEVFKVLAEHGGEVTYEAVAALKYMGQVIDETLRKYPAVPLLNRKCTKTYRLPGTDAFLEEGARVVIPIYALHHDPAYYPDPDTFDPDRFDEANRAKRHPFAYLPFGEGPRMCIGMRFGLMQTRVGLLLLLKSYRFSLNERTTVPVRFDPNAFLLGLKEKIWLDAERVDA